MTVKAKKKPATAPLLGAHTSIAGGVDKAILRAHELGCTATQVFLKYNSRWKGIPVTKSQRKAFFENQEKTGVSCVVAHAGYLINLASPDLTIYQKSVSAMLDELERASLLRIKWLVMHPGSHRGVGITHGINQIAGSLNLLLAKTRGYRVHIILENTAGQGSGIGHRFEQIAQIIRLVKNKRRLGVCLDTAHLFAAGYDIRTREAYEATLNEFDALIGLSRLRVIHLNDSKKPLGSRVDRHEHIGQGAIGLEAFRFIMTDRRFWDVPKILETPKKPQPESDRKNLEVLKSLCH